MRPDPVDVTYWLRTAALFGLVCYTTSRLLSANLQHRAAMAVIKLWYALTLLPVSSSMMKNFHNSQFPR